MADNLLRVEKLTKEFVLDGALVPVLRGVDIGVAPGERLAICGESGAGKTTLLQIMGTLDHPSSGQVYFDGHDVFSWTAEKLASWRNAKIGFVFQFHHLLPEFTALENVMVPPLVQGVSRKSATTMAGDMLARVGLTPRLHHKPGELSGGEQQRVALARALVLRPVLVLADEPTGNLDLRNSLEVEKLLLELNDEFGMALVVVTHSRRLAESMSRTVYLEDGLVRKDATQ
ncbi:MAG: ABC transporter ATP-binding protein [Deltaproteobacteria bacterium]|nr:ABC transporter ATP-binding protein [Candidatus Anaeroferrophillus wilburensis]MBN2889747.1 ABC transporter ATP-binding protein [Deltaproteobacteria bacterium]